MKNKQVKKMMSDVFNGEWIYYRSDFFCTSPFAAGNHGMTLFGGGGLVSITAIDHWLFNHKCEKEAWNVNVKVKVKDETTH